MNVQRVAQAGGVGGVDGDRGGLGEAGAHPAVAADVEGGGVAGVGGVVHQGDAFGDVVSDWAGVVAPFGGLPEELFLARLAGGVADLAAAVVDADRLGHA